MTEYSKEDMFIIWFNKTYKPNKKKPGWYKDKLVPNSSVTIEGAGKIFEHVYTLMEKNNDLHLLIE